MLKPHTARSNLNSMVPSIHSTASDEITMKMRIRSTCKGGRPVPAATAVPAVTVSPTAASEANAAGKDAGNIPILGPSIARLCADPAAASRFISPSRCRGALLRKVVVIGSAK